MKGLTNYITKNNWEDILTVIFVIIDDIYQILPSKYLANRKNTVKGEAEFSDSEVITISLFAEMVFDGQEDKTLHFIRQYHQELFPQLLSNARFNRRKKQLAVMMEVMRCYLRDQWRKENPLDKETEHLRLVDSAPVVMMTYTRGSRCQSVDIEQRKQWFGVCSSKKMKFFGARCHITTTLDQMIDTWLLAPGSFDDRKPMIALLENRQGLAIIADKGYVSADLDNRLWEVGQHLLLSLKRDNQSQQWPAGIQRILGKLRHRVETTFSVLETVFNFQRPKSRSMAGFIVRTTSKILAHTLSFFLARFFSPLTVS